MDEYWELLEEQHEHDVIMTPSRIDYDDCQGEESEREDQMV